MTATITAAGKARSAKQNGVWWRTWPAAGAGALVLLIAVWLVAKALGGEGSSRDGPTYLVTPGPMTVHVTESGTVQAREQVVIKSQVQGQTTIIWIIEEGKHVKEGDLLVELDVSKLEDNRVDQEIRVQNAEAAYIRARESLEITRSKGESDIARALLDHEFAQEDLKKYIEGEYPKELNEYLAKITLAQADLQDAQRTANWSKTLFEEKYIAESELKRDELRLKRAELDLESAIANHDLLTRFTYHRRVREYESDVDQTRMALERVQRQALANGVQDKADRKAKQSELKRQKEKLAKIEDQTRKTKIYSPASGMVIYATTGQSSRRGSDEPLEAGRMVREREELIHLPTANAMLVNIKIHESSLKKVQIGQPVRITINALPGKEYFGKVARIAPLPDAQNFWRGNPDLKVYNTEIHLDGELEGVRTGMTCKAQVIIQQLEDVISVPIQCVLRIAGQPTVYVKRGGSVRSVPVQMGLDNKDTVHIISGLAAGDRVLTNPPLSETSSQVTASSGRQIDKQTSGDQTKHAGDTPSTGGKATLASSLASDTAKSTSGSNAVADGAGPGQDQAHGGPRSGEHSRLSPEQIAKRREQMKNMTPEQRQAMRKRMQGQRGQRRESQADDE